MKLNTPLFETGGFKHLPCPNPAVRTGTRGSWDDRACESGDIFKENGTYYWYYHAYKNPVTDFGNYQIGVCTSKSPTGPWERYKNNPLLRLAENEWERDYWPVPILSKKTTHIICFTTVQFYILRI